MKYIFTFIILISCAELHAQDERYFRKLFSGELRSRVETKKRVKAQFQTAGKYYKYDMNDDGRLESFVSEKRDGIEWLNIHDYTGKVIYRTSLDTKGLNAWLYKISIKNISRDTRVFILHFYEGTVEYLESRSQARLYFLTVDNKDLATLQLFKGPGIFDEYETFKKHYHIRPYQLNLVDFNKDGVRDIIVNYHKNQWIYLYKFPGKWYEL